jgi:hypothetical protein
VKNAVTQPTETSGAPDFAPDVDGVETRTAWVRERFRDQDPTGKVKEYRDIVAASEGYAMTINEPRRSVPPCIYVAGDESAPVLVILEGHARAIARSKFPPRPERALLGVSPSMGNWKWFGP